MLDWWLTPPGVSTCLSADVSSPQFLTCHCPALLSFSFVITTARFVTRLIQFCEIPCMCLLSACSHQCKLSFSFCRRWRICHQHKMMTLLSGNYVPWNDTKDRSGTVSDDQSWEHWVFTLASTSAAHLNLPTTASEQRHGPAMQTFSKSSIYPQ